MLKRLDFIVIRLYVSRTANAKGNTIVITGNSRAFFQLVSVCHKNLSSAHKYIYIYKSIEMVCTGFGLKPRYTSLLVTAVYDVLNSFFFF